MASRLDDLKKVPRRVIGETLSRPKDKSDHALYEETT